MRVALALGLTYLVLAAALIGFSGCAADYAAKECFSIADCDGGRVCFLGSCQDPGYTINSVHAELIPPTSTGYLPQQTDEPLNLGDGYQRIALAPSVRRKGSVTSPDGAQDGTVIARKLGTLKGHDIIRQAAASATSGYSLEVVPGNHDLRFVPSSSSAGSGRPPVAYGVESLLVDERRDLSYPATSVLVVVSGRVFATQDDTVGVEGAYVSGTAQRGPGEILVSSSAITDASGSYTLVFPPGALGIQVFQVAVRPDGNPYVPESKVDVETSSPSSRVLKDVVLGVSPPFDIGASVRTADGTPVPRARVFFAGTKVGTVQGTFSSQLEADADGNAQATLLPGEYVITVVPAKTEPYAVSSSRATLAAGSPPFPPPPLALEVGSKVQLQGTVLTRAGEPVGGARVALSLRRAPTPREYTVDTGAAGEYQLDVDPGEYEIVVEPPVESGLPRYRELRELHGGSASVELRLYNPALVFGQVLDAGGTPISGVSIALYSTELAPDGVAVLVGQALTGSRGEFVVPVPTAE